MNQVRWPFHYVSPVLLPRSARVRKAHQTLVLFGDADFEWSSVKIVSPGKPLRNVTVEISLRDTAKPEFRVPGDIGLVPIFPPMLMKAGSKLTIVSQEMIKAPWYRFWERWRKTEFTVILSGTKVFQRS